MAEEKRLGGSRIQWLILGDAHYSDVGKRSRDHFRKHPLNLHCFSMSEFRRKMHMSYSLNS